MSVQQKEVVLLKRPGKTYPEVDDVFECKQSQINLQDLEQKVQENQILVKVLHISVDATNRVWISGVKTYIDPVLPGQFMKGQAVGEVLYSKSKKFQKGDIVSGLMLWKNYDIIPARGTQKIPKQYPNPSHFLGILGISGLTAYFGLFDVGKLQKGETLVISAAAGAVGVVVIQLAKNLGAKVIAIAGSEQKCNYCKQLGADEVINYKTQSVKKEIPKLAPEGVDVYFDNVGGQMLDDILMFINDFARVVMCGAISQYNAGNQHAIKNYMRLIFKKATMQGFIVIDYHKRYVEAMQYIGKLMQEGKMEFKEHGFNGLENGSKGLQSLLQGKNDGKVIINVQPKSNNPSL